MDSKQLKILKLIQGASLFTYQDRSSEKTKKENNRLLITTNNWLAVKDQFIEERYSTRKHPAWSKTDWAKIEKENLKKIAFSNSDDRQVLKDKYSIELSKIINGRIKSIEQPLSFKWIGENCQLKKLFDELNGKYINATWSKFKQLFGEKDIKSLEPVQWKQTNWELFILIEELSNHFELIEHKEINVKILNCFIDKSGNQFKINSIKQQKSDAKNGMAGSKSKQDNLKRILQAVSKAQE